MQIDPLDGVDRTVSVVPMNFRTDYKERGGKLVESDKVDLVKRGSLASTPYSIKELRKDNILWPMVEPYYEAWKKGQEVPEDGTPIDALPFIPRDLAGHLKLMQFRTAEELAACTDSDLDRIGMGARGFREKAKSFLENQASGQVAAQNAELKAQNEALLADLEELKAQVNELANNKPKRGRPRKDIE